MQVIIKSILVVRVKSLVEELSWQKETESPTKIKSTTLDINSWDKT